MKRMRSEIIGIAAISFGLGILIGGLLPGWLIVWIMGIALLTAGFFLLHC